MKEYISPILLVFQITEITVEEPETKTVKVDLPIIRNAGTLGNVTITWIATLDGQIADGDLQVFAGAIQFLPGETIKNLTLEIMADDVPEIDEVSLGIQQNVIGVGGGHRT